MPKKSANKAQPTKDASKTKSIVKEKKISRQNTRTQRKPKAAAQTSKNKITPTSDRKLRPRTQIDNPILAILQQSESRPNDSKKRTDEDILFGPQVVEEMAPLQSKMSICGNVKQKPNNEQEAYRPSARALKMVEFKKVQQNRASDIKFGQPSKVHQNQSLIESIIGVSDKYVRQQSPRASPKHQKCVKWANQIQADRDSLMISIPRSPQRPLTTIGLTNQGANLERLGGKTAKDKTRERKLISLESQSTSDIETRSQRKKQESRRSEKADSKARNHFNNQVDLYRREQIELVKQIIDLHLRAHVQKTGDSSLLKKYDKETNAYIARLMKIMCK